MKTMSENKMPRLLNADEIDARVKTWDKVGKKWAMLLLYKDARVDQRLMDETYGMMNWQRSHELIDGNLYCTVSVFNERTHCWVAKQDVGTESDTEKEKGQASDSFKRACFNWGIGRELYTAPSIFVPTVESDYDKNGKFKTEIFVSKIGYNDKREITMLELSDRHRVRFAFGNATSTATQPASKKTTAAKKVEKVKELAEKLNADPQPAPKSPVTTTDLPEGWTQEDYLGVIDQLEECKTKQDVKTVHAAFPQLANYQPFRNACNAKFKTLVA